jgi:hypothetical protein
MDMNSKTIQIKKDNYVVKAKYPKLQSPENNRILKSFLMKQITIFQSTYGTDDQDYKHKLKINYKIYNSKKYKSIVFKLRFLEERDLENMFFKTFVFDKDSEELVHISKIIDSEGKLVLASQITRNKLKELMSAQEFDADRVYRGAGPNIKNFKNYYFDGNELHILINPYQVADFDAGYYDIVVDFSAHKTQM